VTGPAAERVHNPYLPTVTAGGGAKAKLVGALRMHVVACWNGWRTGSANCERLAVSSGMLRFNTSSPIAARADVLPQAARALAAGPHRACRQGCTGGSGR